MIDHDQKKDPLRVADSEGNSYSDDLLKNGGAENSTTPNASASWIKGIEQSIQLGEQFLAVIGGIVDLARAEALLAVRTLPKLLMLWLLMLPVILLTWLAFSALVAWSVFAASDEVGLGMLTFFLQQVLLLLVCCWLFVRYRTRMTLPYTRAQIDNFIRSTLNDFNGKDKTKE